MGGKKEKEDKETMVGGGGRGGVKNRNQQKREGSAKMKEGMVLYNLLDFASCLQGDPKAVQAGLLAGHKEL